MGSSMKKVKLILGALVLLMSGQVNSALIDNGDWTTDTSTGLDWLDLNLTYAMSVDTASSTYSGWQLASTSEYDNLFDTIFPNYTTPKSLTYDSGIANDFDKHASQLETFFSLFGEAPPSDPGRSWVQAFFLAENTGLDLMQLNLQRAEERVVIDPHDYRGYDSDDTGGAAGLFLVRDTCSGFPGGGHTGGAFPGGGNTGGCFPGKVPAPAAIWLFGTGIIGLIGFSRRRRAG
jgi:hypothetical protein